jgi:hypothetical protein
MNCGRNVRQSQGHPAMRPLRANVLASAVLPARTTIVKVLKAMGSTVANPKLVLSEQSPPSTPVMVMRVLPRQATAKKQPFHQKQVAMVQLPLSCHTPTPIMFCPPVHGLPPRQRQTPATARVICRFLPHGGPLKCSLALEQLRLLTCPHPLPISTPCGAPARGNSEGEGLTTCPDLRVRAMAYHPSPSFQRMTVRRPPQHGSVVRPHRGKVVLQRRGKVTPPHPGSVGQAE